MEIWIEIKNVPKYYISNFGRVKSSKNRILKTKTNTHGYEEITLKINGISKRIRVHRLVAEAFIPNQEQKPYINHIDGNKLNNNVNNLEWCTQSENVKHSIYILGNKKPVENLYHYKKKVKCVETQEEFSSVIEAAKKYNIEHSNISRCCLGKRKTCGKLHWIFIE